MNLPLYNHLKALAETKTIRFHMPGHKGMPGAASLACQVALDFTETYETGNLYDDEGAIRDAELAAAAFYKAADCRFLTGGSTQGVLSMLGAAAAPGDTVLLDRGCHRSTAHACALLDLNPCFIYPETAEPMGIPGQLSPAVVEDMLQSDPSIRAVLVVSPTYHGIIRDLPALAAVCHAHNALLLVDAAHGAHLPAVGLPSPIACGADLATLSAHKTLDALGQGAYLLAGSAVAHDALREKTALFGTSSPSYLIMASLDLARGQLEADDSYRKTAEAVAETRRYLAKNTSFLPLDDNTRPLDPCRLTVCTAGTDLSSDRLSDRLYEEYRIACEMSDDRNVVFIVTPADLPHNLAALTAALCDISRSVHAAPLPAPLPPLPSAESVRPVRSSLLGRCRTVPLEQAVGAVCARPVTPYPPGIPVLWPGEEIRPKHIELLQSRCYNKVSSITICDER